MLPKPTTLVARTNTVSNASIPRSPTNVTFGESGGEEALSDFVSTAKQNVCVAIAIKFATYSDDVT